ncbi:HAD-IA family hydrolase [Candidatus Pelagibacter sp.]|nr:HAD-IA family hydrolase [Candidatus Pelagibacter sp.]
MIFIYYIKSLKIFFSRKIYINDVYYCPHHPLYGQGIYLKKCFCRKPQPGLIFKAIKENSLNKSNTVMIGDKKSDYLAARKAKIKFYYVENNLFSQIKKIF